MNTFSYDRPREKMLQKGVTALTNAELLQVMIGSGTIGMPVAKIARKLDKVLKSIKGTPTLEMLSAIPGLGKVKSAQIVASYELVNRMVYQSEVKEVESDILGDLYSAIREAKKQTLLCIFFDGAGRVIDDFTIPLDASADTNKIVRKLFANALSQSAAHLLLAIGWKRQPSEPTLFELNLARDAYAMASLLSIPLRQLLLINEDGASAIKDQSHG